MKRVWLFGSLLVLETVLAGSAEAGQSAGAWQGNPKRVEEYVEGDHKEGDDWDEAVLRTKPKVELNDEHKAKQKCGDAAKGVAGTPDGAKGVLRPDTSQPPTGEPKENEFSIAPPALKIAGKEDPCPDTAGKAMNDWIEFIGEPDSEKGEAMRLQKVIDKTQEDVTSWQKQADEAEGWWKDATDTLIEDARHDDKNGNEAKAYADKWSHLQVQLQGLLELKSWLDENKCRRAEREETYREYTKSKCWIRWKVNKEVSDISAELKEANKLTPDVLAARLRAAIGGKGIDADVAQGALEEYFGQGAGKDLPPEFAQAAGVTPKPAKPVVPDGKTQVTVGGKPVNVNASESAQAGEGYWQISTRILNQLGNPPGITAAQLWPIVKKHMRDASGNPVNRPDNTVYMSDTVDVATVLQEAGLA